MLAKRGPIVTCNALTMVWSRRITDLDFDQRNI